VFLEKLTGLQLVKKFPAFHGTRRYITALTSVRHLSIRTEARFITKQSSSRKSVHTSDSCSLWALSVTQHTSRPTLVASLLLADMLGSLRARVISLIGLLLLVVLFVKFAEALGRYRSKKVAATTTTTTTTAHLVALRFKPEGRGFDSRIFLEFFIDITLPAALWCRGRLSL